MKNKNSQNIHTSWFKTYKAIVIKAVQNQRDDKLRDKRNRTEPRNRPVKTDNPPAQAHILKHKVSLTGLRFMPSVLSDYKEVKVNQ